MKSKKCYIRTTMLYLEQQRYIPIYLNISTAKAIWETAKNYKLVMMPIWETGIPI